LSFKQQTLVALIQVKKEGTQVTFPVWSIIFRLNRGVFSNFNVLQTIFIACRGVNVCEGGR